MSRTLTVEPSVALAELAGPAAEVAPGALLEVTPEGYRLDGRDVRDPRVLADEMEQAALLAGLAGDTPSGGLLVGVAAQTKGTRVV